MPSLPSRSKILAISLKNCKIPVTELSIEGINLLDFAICPNYILASLISQKI